MKKYTLLLTAVLFMSIACQEKFQEENLPDQPTDLPDFEAVTDLFPAVSRTALLPDGQLIWKADDRISVFAKSTVSVPYKVKSGTEGSTTCTFTPVHPEKGMEQGKPLSCNVAVYGSEPAGGISLSETGKGIFVLHRDLPREIGIERPDFFRSDHFAMVAVSSDTHLAFKNCYGLVEFQFKGTAVIRQMTLTGRRGEFVSGKHTVTFSGDQDPVCAPEGDFQQDWFPKLTIALNDVALQPDMWVHFYLVLPPTEFKDGFDVVLTDVEGKTFSCHASAGSVVRRNDVLVMPPLEVKTVETLPVVKITHNLYFYTIPVFSGELSEGSIKWGDQIEEAYRTAAQHTYNTGGEHEVEIAVRGAEGIHFDNLTGISGINLSQF